MSTIITPAMYKAKMEKRRTAQKAMEIRRVDSFIESLKRDINSALSSCGDLDPIKLNYSDSDLRFTYLCSPGRLYHDVFQGKWNQMIECYFNAGWDIRITWDAFDTCRHKISIKEKL